MRSTAQSLDAQDAIHEALNFNYRTDALQSYYDKWAKCYDKDVSDENYCGPEYIVSFFSKIESQNGVNINIDDLNLKILDAGCGTGLVGKVLCDRGYCHVDGFDLSEKMVEEARRRNAYRCLTTGCNMTDRIEAYDDNQYDVTFCCGVFTTGHVPPESLQELIRITKPGGLVVLSTRKSYYNNSNIEPIWQEFQHQGQVKLVEKVMNGPYLDEEGAHYWAFQVC